MYGFHPDTVHESAVTRVAELRRIARRRQCRVPLRARHWLATRRSH